MECNILNTNYRLARKQYKTTFMSNFIYGLGKCNHLCMMLMGILIICGISSCSKDDDGAEEKGSEENVVVDNNGVASDGHSFTRIDDKNFYIDDIKYTVVDSTLEVTGYDATFFKGEAHIISSLNYHETLLYVRSIGANAFKSCDVLTKISIPQNITAIKGGAFKNCKGLNLLSIKGEGLISIGYSAFEGCENLSSIIIPNSVVGIGSNSFSGCVGLTTVTIPNSVTSIGDNAFAGCSQLTSVVMGDGVTTIGSKTFSGCYNLKSISLGNSLASIGKDAFINCNYLESIVVASGNTKYDSRDDCNAIIETASNTLILGFKTTTIPNSITTIGERAFANCVGLTFITIPNSVTSIDKYAFYGCTTLTSVNIPDGVTSIDACAFDACNSLTSVYIGNGVKFIDLSAFLGCAKLYDIYLYASTPPSHVYSTKYSAKIRTVTLHVPAESIKAYNRFPWEQFGRIVSI